MLFLEFSNAYGIKHGTNIYFRGIPIGHVKNVYVKINSIIILAYINTPKILIPKKSLIEVNQVGLFNDIVIDIVPLENIKLYENINVTLNKPCISVFSQNCLSSPFLCNYHYLLGNRGLNYDDLVRASTRIVQRFDDPRFFNLFYIFLQNNIDISSNFVNMSYYLRKIFYLLICYIYIYLYNYIL